MQTERLRLDDYVVEDAEEAMAINGDEEVMQFLGGVQHRTAAELAEFIGEFSVKYAAYRAAGLPYGVWAVRATHSGALVGTALLKPLPDHDRADTDAIEIGWHLARAVWGKGYATEFGRALVDRAFSTLPIDTLHAVVPPGNVRSEAVARRLGFTHGGQTDAWYGRTLEHYTLSRREFTGT
ncbi:MAG: GNAT family N-acetyltransferase [Sandaracinaceae bacterium]